MITRDHFALNYSGYDSTQPPPMGFITPHRNRAIDTKGRILRGGWVQLAPSPPNYMADLTDPSTWQRPYRFT